MAGMEAVLEVSMSEYNTNLKDKSIFFWKIARFLKGEFTGSSYLLSQKSLH